MTKKILAEFFRFLAYKAEHEGFTLEEEQALMGFFQNSIPISATADDLSKFYRRSPEAIRAVVSRKMLGKPKRRVLYSFNEFRKVVPDKWKV